MGLSVKAFVIDCSHFNWTTQLLPWSTHMFGSNAGWLVSTICRTHGFLSISLLKWLCFLCVGGVGDIFLKGKTFDLEPDPFLDLYSIVRVSIWLWLTGWNFAGKVRTSLKLRSMTTKCLQYAVWHIINNSSVALDGAQPKESMNSPWLHPAVPFGKTPVGYCPGSGFWMFISPTSCLYPIVYFFSTL